MAKKEKVTTRFQRLLKDKKLLLMPGGFSPIAARMVQEAGLDSFFLAGSQTSAYVYGLPDVGLMGREEMTLATQRVTATCDIPIFVDADTGYGNALNVYHAVQGYIRARAAGLHIEDQEFPKRSGTGAGRKCISQEEAIGKFRAAMAAKQELDEDFVICARCDLIGAENGSFEEAVERCIAYVEEAKVDLIWLNNVQTAEEVRIAAEKIPGAVIPHFGGPPPAPTLQELEDMGVAACLFPGMTSSMGLQATWDLLNELKQRGQAALDERPSPAPSKWGRVRFDTFAAFSHEEITRMEGEFLPSEQQRDYESTFGHYGMEAGKRAGQST
jgi:2-methylisocitrate lyase-like PEP mutase family enzyme